MKGRLRPRVLNNMFQDRATEIPNGRDGGKAAFQERSCKTMERRRDAENLKYPNSPNINQDK